MVPSCTAALEASVVLAGVGLGDEVVLPSFAYPTCASSVIRAGGTPLFVDIELDTLCIEERWLRQAITNQTKAVMPIWYAGVQGDWVAQITQGRGVKLIEDAAQCIANFKLRGDFGAISFHHTKNVGCGEGGALLVQEKDYERARVYCSCGTNRYRDRKNWSWVGLGTSYLMAQPLAQMLYPELESCYETTERRLRVWKVYRDNIKASHKACLPGNGHIFWFMSDKQGELLSRLPELTKHYEPLHLCKPALEWGRTFGPMENSIYAAKHIVRPPMNVTEDAAYRCAERINKIL